MKNKYLTIHSLIVKSFKTSNKTEFVKGGKAASCDTNCNISWCITNDVELCNEDARI